MWPERPPASQWRMLLRVAASGGELTKRELTEGSDPAGAQRSRWDVLRLEQAGFIEPIGLETLGLTPRGRAAANPRPPGMAQLAEFIAALEDALKRALIAHIHAAPPRFFETLTIDLLAAMGYGGRRHDLARRVGGSHDGGIDGLIDRDELGLDTIFVQAKRYAPSALVPLADIRDFAGALDAQRAAKGVFVTSARFSPAAAEFCRHLSRRIALIDGTRLAELMIRHGVGVKLIETWHVRKIDEAYFSNHRGTDAATAETSDTSSASIQPRR